MWGVIRVIALLELLPFVYSGHDCMTTIVYGYYVAKCQNLGLTDIPWNLPHNVHKMHFEGNHIRRLQNTPFDKYKMTKELYLSNNSLSEIGSNAFAGLEKLELLNLERNDLTVVPTDAMKYLPNLKVLLLKYNKLTYIDNDAFAGLTSLKEMYLNFNSIINLAPHSFSNIPQMQWFSLENNLLRTIDARVLNHFNNLLVIRLYNNPWQCDCSLRWFKIWLTKIERTRSVNWRFRNNEPQCHSPPHVAGMKFSDVDVDKFACPAHISTVARVITLKTLGDDVEMDCKASGDPVPSIVWYKNGYKITDNADKRYVISTNTTDITESQLKIVKFRKKDIASYLCLSSNTGGTYNITYNIRLEGFKGKIIPPTKTDAVDKTSTATSIFSLDRKTITMIAIIAGCVIFILAFALILGIICHNRRNRRRRQPPAKVTTTTVQSNGTTPKDYSMYEDIACNDKNLFRELNGDSPYELMKPKHVETFNEPRYCTYISFRSDPSDPDDLTNYYPPNNQTCSRDNSHTESTSPLIEGYRMNVPSPRFMEQMYIHEKNQLNEYCNTLPHPTAPHAIPYGTPPSERRSTKRSSSVGSLSNIIPPKKPPRLNQESPDSENLSFGSFVTTPNVDRRGGTPL